MGLYYYCLGHLSDNALPVALKCYGFFNRLSLNLLKTVILLTNKVVLGDHPTGLRKNRLSYN